MNYKILNAKDWENEQYFPIFIILIPNQSNISYNEQFSEIFKKYTSKAS